MVLASTLVTAVEQWQAKYDKPELTREEKAVELLGYLREKVSIPDQELLDAIDNLLKAEDTDKGSEADDVD